MSPGKPTLERIVVEGLRPCVDGGRHAVKRLVGDVIDLAATVYRDGHDLLDADVLLRPPGARSWRRAPMRYEKELDRVRAAVELDAIGLWKFAVEAWTNHFETWRLDLEKRVVAGQDVELEIREGALLIEAAAERANGADAAALREAVARLASGSLSVDERVRTALDETLVPLVRRHGVREGKTRSAETGLVRVDRREAGIGAWYEMFPRSWPDDGGHGTFASAARRLPEIARMGFDVVYLPPIHPIGRGYRKGPNNALVAGPDDPGSPWAIGAAEGGHDAVHPELGTLEDFRTFVVAARDLGMEVALDYALQCSADHPWLEEHPDWFFRRPDGSIRYAENPPKKYQDIYPLDFWCDDREGLWNACRDVLLHWIGQGVRTFRVDNPHTKPFAFWEWMLASILDEHPDVVFLSEAFTRPARMYGLAKLGFTQSYTYFTWRNEAWEIRRYLEELTQTEVAEFFRPNFFVNTPDILHEVLQHGGPPAFRIRLLLAATLSPLWGMYSGFELFENIPVKAGSEEYWNSEKYEIVERRWDAPGNLKNEVALLNRMRREQPALQQLRNLSFHPSENDRILFYLKEAPGADLLIAATTNPERAEETMVHVPLDAMGLAEDEAYVVRDLLTGEAYTWRGRRNYVRLDPMAGRAGHVLCVER